jgi:hypothetical protein
LERKHSPAKPMVPLRSVSCTRTIRRRIPIVVDLNDSTTHEYIHQHFYGIQVESYGTVSLYICNMHIKTERPSRRRERLDL